MTTGTSPTTDTQPTAPTRKAGGGRRSATPTATATGRPTRRLVIVESPTKAKKIARLPGRGLRRRVVRRPHPRPAARRRRRAGQVQGRAVGPARRRRRQRLRSRSTSSRRTKKGKVTKLQRRCSRAPTSCSSPRTRTARARPSPGTCSRRSSRRCRSGGWSSTRSPEPAIRAAVDEPARHRPGPGRRAGDPPHPRPALRLRGLPGAVEEGHAEAVGGPGAVGRHPDRRRARARADGVPSPPAYWDIAADPRRRRRRRRRARSRRALVAVDGDRVATGRDFDPDGRLEAGADVVHLDEDGARGLAAAAATAATVRRSLRVEEKPYTPPAVRAVHDLDAAAGGRPQAALLGRAHDAHAPSGCTRTATSPTCAPTRRTLSETAIDAARAQAARAVRRRVRARRRRGSTPAR